MVRCGIAACRATGHPMPYLPLHKGADGFMYERQFETFYWPTLRKVANIKAMIDFSREYGICR